MISFKPRSDYQPNADAKAPCPANITQCDHCGHERFIRSETISHICRVDEAGVLRIDEEMPADYLVEYLCEDCCQEHEAHQFREIAW